MYLSDALKKEIAALPTRQKLDEAEELMSHRCHALRKAEERPGYRQAWYVDHMSRLPQRLKAEVLKITEPEEIEEYMQFISWRRGLVPARELFSDENLGLKHI